MIEKSRIRGEMTMNINQTTNNNVLINIVLKRDGNYLTKTSDGTFI